MKAEKRYRRILILLFLISLGGIAVLSYYYIHISQIPDIVSVFREREEVVSFLPKSWIFPVSGKIVPAKEDGETKKKKEETEESLKVSCYQGSTKLPSDLLHINLSSSVAIEANKKGSYEMEIRSFGILLKKVNLQVLEQEAVIPCGNIVGIYGETDGVLVLGTGEVTDSHGKKQEPAYNIVHSGDYIIEADKVPVKGKEELLELLEKSDGSSMELKLRRNGKILSTVLTPVKTADEGYRFGIWVRNDTQGIGTLTFLTEDGRFGALGHAITDIDTGELVDLSDAGLYQAEIGSVKKGEPGVPGEIAGIIHIGEEYKLGAILQNTEQGIFGGLSDKITIGSVQKSIPVALKQEISTGKAQIFCQIGRERKLYEVEIEKIDKSPDITSKGMVIHITDQELLKQTNGIIQGMSGSPVIQNGKFIGAVTHVFVNDSTRGYGIFAENMLFHLQN